MSDSRSIVSSWQSESTANSNLISSNKITSNWMYRKYLQTNAIDIMKANYIESANDTGYIVPANGQMQGIAQSIQPSSDLKVTYLNREQLSASKNVHRDALSSFEGFR